MIKEKLESITKENGYLGWTITPINNTEEKLELIISPKYKNDYRPIDENDSIDISIKRSGDELYNLGQISNILQSFTEFEVSYTGRITVFVWKGIKQHKNKLHYALEYVLELLNNSQSFKYLSKGYFINEIYFDETCNDFYIN